jgi:hypothetical protein
MMTLRCPCGGSFKVTPESVGRMVVAPCCQAKLRIGAAATKPSPSASSTEARPAQARPGATHNPPVAASRAVASAVVASPVVAGPVVANADTVATKCTCGQRLRVQKSANALKVVCPKCKQTLRVRPTLSAAATAAQTQASSESMFWGDLASQRPAIDPTIGQQAAFHSVANAAQPACLPAAPPSPANPKSFQSTNWHTISQQSGSLYAGTSHPANLHPASLHHRKPAGNAGRVLHWMNGHRWVTIVAGLNLIALTSCILVPPALLAVMPSMVLGLVIIGLLFIPRQHILERLAAAIGSQASSAGAGGILLIVALAVLKGFNRIQRNDKLDFSGFADPSNLGIIMGALVLPVCILAVFFVLWRYIGLMRVAAAGYSLWMSLLILVIVVGGIFGSVAGMHNFQNRDDLPPMHEAGRPGFRDYQGHESGPWHGGSSPYGTRDPRR